MRKVLFVVMETGKDRAIDFEGNGGLPRGAKVAQRWKSLSLSAEASTHKPTCPNWAGPSGPVGGPLLAFSTVSQSGVSLISEKFENPHPSHEAYLVLSLECDIVALLWLVLAYLGQY
jgi:hypothetical protein